MIKLSIFFSLLSFSIFANCPEGYSKIELSNITVQEMLGFMKYNPVYMIFQHDIIIKKLKKSNTTTNYSSENDSLDFTVTSSARALLPYKKKIFANKPYLITVTDSDDLNKELKLKSPTFSYTVHNKSDFNLKEMNLNGLSSRFNKVEFCTLSNISDAVEL